MSNFIFKIKKEVKLFKNFGLILTIVALIMATIQTRQAVVQTRQLNTLSKSISTRYIGGFPKFMTPINDMIGEAKTKVIIFQDIATYGIYSNTEEFHKNLSLLTQKATQNVEIELFLYDKELREVSLMESFGIKSFSYKRKEDMDAAIDSLIKDSRLKQFFSKYPKNKYTYEKFYNYEFEGKKITDITCTKFDSLSVIKKKYLKKDIDSLNWADFHGAIEEMTLFTEKELKNQGNIKIYPISSRHIMSCWLIDDKKAAFGYMLNNGPLSEIAFLTNDDNIITFINLLADDMRKEFKE